MQEVQGTNPLSFTWAGPTTKGNEIIGAVELIFSSNEKFLIEVPTEAPEKPQKLPFTQKEKQLFSIDATVDQIRNMHLRVSLFQENESISRMNSPRSPRLIRRNVEVNLKLPLKIMAGQPYGILFISDEAFTADLFKDNESQEN